MIVLDLLKILIARLDIAFEDSGFEQPKQPELVDPLLKIGYLAAKKAGNDIDESFPFGLLRPLDGSGDQSKETLKIQLEGGVFTSGDLESGFGEIERYVAIVRTLQRDRAFTPYHLELPITWKYGEHDGQQPHPYYYVTITMLFKRAPQALSRR